MVPQRRKVEGGFTSFDADGRLGAVAVRDPPEEEVEARWPGARVAVDAEPAADWRARQRGG